MIETGDSDYEILEIQNTPIGEILNGIKIRDNLSEVNVKKTMIITRIDIMEKFQGQGLSWILLCNSVKIAKTMFDAKWMMLIRTTTMCLKEYYEKFGFIDIQYKR